MNTAMPSPYRLGADNGFRFGLYLTAIYSAMLGSAVAPLFNLLFFALALGTPLMLYRLVAASQRECDGRMPTGYLWMTGLMTAICGGLLASVPLVVTLQWILPDYLPQQWEVMLQALEASADPASREMAAQCRVAAGNGFYISAMDMAVTLLWCAAFLGSVVSLPVALLLRGKQQKRLKGNGY